MYIQYIICTASGARWWHWKQWFWTRRVSTNRVCGGGAATNYAVRPKINTTCIKSILFSNILRFRSSLVALETLVLNARGLQRPSGWGSYSKLCVASQLSNGVCNSKTKIINTRRFVSLLVALKTMLLNERVLKKVAWTERLQQITWWLTIHK